MMRHRILVGVMFGALSIGCAVQPRGKVTERQSTSVDLTAFKTAAIEVTVLDSVTNGERIRGELTDAVSRTLRSRHVFTSIVIADRVDQPSDVPETDLRVKVSITYANEESLGMTVGAHVELVDAKTNKMIGAVDVSESGRDSGHRGANQIGAGQAACTALVNRLADYIDDHRTK
jgi:hypothetical protein